LPSGWYADMGSALRLRQMPSLRFIWADTGLLVKIWPSTRTSSQSRLDRRSRALPGVKVGLTVNFIRISLECRCRGLSKYIGLRWTGARLVEASW
jgi:hypothetical protein